MDSRRLCGHLLCRRLRLPLHLFFSKAGTTIGVPVETSERILLMLNSTPRATG